MRTAHVAVALIGTLAVSAGGQNPQRHFTEGVDARFARTMPSLSYILTIRPGDTTGFDVRLALRNAPDTFRLALAKHPEYDDRFHRYVENVVADPNVTITQVDSALWRVVAPGGVATIDYRIALPPAESPRAAWRPFSSPTGALTGGIQTFMYVVGAELAPAHVELRIPEGWDVVTGLTPTRQPHTFFAPNAYVLVESPMLVGRLRTWDFFIDGVPHTIAYWPKPDGARFDTAAFVAGIERLTLEAVKLFGRPPYREYVFQFQDDAWGGLEHPNSVSLGAENRLLSGDPNALLEETAHEFIHTWNLMRIRPAEYVGVSYRPIQPVPTLWFSEGLTMFYADLLLRRAGVPASGGTRTEHLQETIARYLSQPGNARFSAEQVSRVAYNAPPDALGDYTANAHLQGEVLGSLLDIMIRDASDGKRSMDDVMRLLLERTGGPRGMTGADIERAVADVCGCAAKPFFDAHVRGAQRLDFNRYLALLGLRMEVAWDTARREDLAIPDHRIWAYNPPGDSLLALLVNNPETVWGKAGLHSGDRVISMNGNAVRTWPQFRQILAASRIGDIVHFVVQPRRATAPTTVTVRVTGYTRPVVTISEIAGATEKQVRLRAAWVRGAP